MKEDIVFKCTTGNRLSVFTQDSYCLQYKKGTTVEAPKNTMGIMCFDTRKHAESFAVTHGVEAFEIITVKGVGEGKVPTAIAKCQWSGYLNAFYSVFRPEGLDAHMPPYEKFNLELLFGKGIIDFDMQDRLNMEASLQVHLAPVGTVCYNAVEVLE